MPRRLRGHDETRQGVEEIMAIADRQGLPVAVYVESATPHEVTLVHATLAERFVSQLPGVSSATTATSRTGWIRNWRAVAWN